MLVGVVLGIAPPLVAMRSVLFGLLWMPHKFNADRRDKLPKHKRGVTNWAEYNASRRRRRDLMVWIKEDALGVWTAPRRRTRGGQRPSSDLAIEPCLTLGMVFKQPLRQTQGLMRSIAGLLGVAISVPGFSTLPQKQWANIACDAKACRWSASPFGRPFSTICIACQARDGTCLKIFGEGDWLEKKHKTKGKGRSWRKRHLGLDLVSGEIICADLTLENVGDPTALPEILDQVDGPVTRFLANGAYDGMPTSDLLNLRLGYAVEIIIPPPKSAVYSAQSLHDRSPRDQHIAEIQSHGRLTWQVCSGDK